MGIFLTKGGGNGGNTPTPTPTEIKLYSEDDSIEVIQEFDENDNPTGWTNIERRNDLASEELEVGARVFMNFAEEDIVKKQQTYILSTNNGRKIEVTISGKYTIESLDDINISVRGDVEDDDAMWVRLYMDPGDENGNRYQGYFFIIYFNGPYQWTQDDDEAFYVSANSDKRLINWMWNGLSAGAYERLEEVDEGIFNLIDYSNNSNNSNSSNGFCLIHYEYNNITNALSNYPIMSIHNNLKILNGIGVFEISDNDIIGDFVYNSMINEYLFSLKNLSLNPLNLDSNLTKLEFEKDDFFPKYRILTNEEAYYFLSKCPYYNIDENDFIFVLDIEVSNINGFFANNTNVFDGFIPRFTYADDLHEYLSIGRTFENCINMTSADLDCAKGFDNINYTFSGCTNLTTVNIRQRYKFVENMSYAFYNCTSLSYIKFREFKIQHSYNIANFNTMFSGCAALLTIDLISCSPDFVTLIQSIAPSGVTVNVYNVS